MRLRTWVSHARVGRDQYRVIQPRRRLERAYLLTDLGESGTPRHLQMFVDRTAAVVLSATWALATISRRSLVYVPMRHTAMPVGLDWDDSTTALDLVLMHHCLQFPPSRWKRVRAQLGQGSPHIATMGTGALGRQLQTDDALWSRRNPRDRLRFTLVGATVFVTGSTRAFQTWGSDLQALTVEAGPYVKKHRGAWHYCVEIDNRWQLGGYDRDWTMWHIEYCRRWRV